MSNPVDVPFPAVLTNLFNHLDDNPKPNFTQYQLTLDELVRVFDINDFVAARATRKLRHVLEARFGLATLDDLVDQ